VIQFVVYGTPAPGGSKRAIRTGGYVRVIDANPNAAPWKQQVAGAAITAMNGQAPYRGPVELTAVFFRRRPAAHYGTGRNADVVKPGAPWAPTSAPDALKLGRLVEDAMSGIVYSDDAVIVDEYLSKRYGLPERVEITIRFLEAIPLNGTTVQAEIAV
jgi:crossover junction endodeoxyribonuclease RusA